MKLLISAIILLIITSLFFLKNNEVSTEKKLIRHLKNTAKSTESEISKAIQEQTVKPSSELLKSSSLELSMIQADENPKEFFDKIENEIKNTAPAGRFLLRKKYVELLVNHKDKALVESFLTQQIQDISTSTEESDLMKQYYVLLHSLELVTRSKEDYIRRLEFLKPLIKEEVAIELINNEVLRIQNEIRIDRGEEDEDSSSPSN